MTLIAPRGPPGSLAAHDGDTDADTDALTNPVKGNLVEKVSQAPFFSTYRHQAFGDDLSFWYFDYQAYWAAGGKRKKGHRLKDYLKWVTWECTPLPCHAGWTEHKRQTWVRQQVRDAENDAKVYSGLLSVIRP